MTSKLVSPPQDDQWTAPYGAGPRAADPGDDDLLHEALQAARRRMGLLEEELRETRERLLSMERMAALGRITAGIAHEINSPLGGVLSSVRAARDFVGEYERSAADPEITPEDHRAIASDILEALQTAEGAAERVVRFVKSIKSHTRSAGARATEFDPADEVDSTVTLLQHELRHRGISVLTEMERGHRVSGDQAKFGMVVQNLVSNALDSYEGRSGEVWIRLRADGDRLRMIVEDRGCGIAEELRGKVFDYLFTTKEVGQGTGLGLPLVDSVVTKSFHGEIELESEVGRGTTFTITLPYIAAESEHGA